MAASEQILLDWYLDSSKIIDKTVKKETCKTKIYTFPETKARSSRKYKFCFSLKLLNLLSDNFEHQLSQNESNICLFDLSYWAPTF